MTLKEKYVKQEIRIEEFITEVGILQSSGGEGYDEEIPIDPTPEEPAANSRRGTWGDLWSTEE